MNTLVNQLADQLGIDRAQAESGVAAFLKLVEEQAPEQFAPLVDAVPGGAAFVQRMAPSTPASALNADSLGGVGELLGGLLGGRPAAQPDRDGGGLDDLLGGLGGLLGGGRPSAGSGGDLGDVLGGILGGSSEGRRPEASGGGLGDVLGGILGGGGAAPVQSSGGAALLGFFATLLRNGFSLETVARFLPALLGLLRGQAGNDVIGGVLQNVPLLKEVLGGARQRAGNQAGGDDGFGLDDLLGQVLGRR